ncbi:MAG: 6-phosphogluconolactonase [candidate division Zixibacteria bacterium]
MGAKDGKKKIEKRIFDSIKALADTAAEALLKLANEMGDRSLFIGLSGGNTPRVIYQRLAEEPYKSGIPWNRIHLFWGDERCVPPQHPDSNFGMVSESLLSRISIPGKNVHRLKGENRPDEEAEAYEKEIRKIVPKSKSGIPRFDWIFLGLGTDGHTASLFPGSKSLEETKRICVAAIHPESGRKRITCTLPLINNAARISIFITGKDKGEIVAEILKGKEGHVKYPAAMIGPSDGILEWWMDKSATRR